MKNSIRKLRKTLVFVEERDQQSDYCDAQWGERPNSIRRCNLSVIDICPYLSFSFVLPNVWVFKHVLYM
jgi:hypothetical protein